jgi:hypothetical protein
MSIMAADHLYVSAKPSGHGGYSQWRAPPRAAPASPAMGCAIGSIPARPGTSLMCQRPERLEGWVRITVAIGITKRRRDLDNVMSKALFLIC